MRLGSRICQEAECVRTGVRGVALPGKWRSRFVAKRWSTRAMARQCSLIQSIVSRIWHVSAAVVAEQDKHEQQAKSQGGNEEEVDRDDGSGVSRQEGVPSRRRP